ncbi:OsmC family protein [Microbacterium sp.]|uniref:OsmC family protein n=1 Tax=Microbacterium sp. TaxID=51671 RepID=UPI003C70C784
MTVRYRTSAINHDGGDGVTAVPDGLAVSVFNPLSPDADTTASNPEQLLALAWATCLNATAQAVVGRERRTAVRVEVALRDAERRPGYEFEVTAFLSAEGFDDEATTRLADAAHARCPVSRLLHGAPTATVRTEAYVTAAA